MKSVRDEWLIRWINHRTQQPKKGGIHPTTQAKTKNQKTTHIMSMSMTIPSCFINLASTVDIAITRPRLLLRQLQITERPRSRRRARRRRAGMRAGETWSVGFWRHVFLAVPFLQRSESLMRERGCELWFLLCRRLSESSGLGWLDLVLRYPSRLSKNGEAVRFQFTILQN